jgi:hypothetical protein
MICSPVLGEFQIENWTTKSINLNFVPMVDGGTLHKDQRHPPTTTPEPLLTKQTQRYSNLVFKRLNHHG